jgi:mono/diheme cytochrome c family protein
LPPVGHLDRGPSGLGKVTSGLALLVVLGAGAGWVLSAPAAPLDADMLDGLSGDPVRGATVFAIAGCASCHTAPDAAYSLTPVLAGGQRFASDFGTFLAPNISPDPDNGIGGWTDLQIIGAALHGVTPDGSHLYPAFPYGSYGKASLQDMLDLVTFWRTLPPDATPSQPHEVSFPFSIRRAVGLWKLLFGGAQFVVQGDLTPEQTRGRYLVEALGHCAECHTPRNALGGLARGEWLAGAPNPSGEGRIPNITPGRLTWSATEIAEYLKSGFTPEFDTAGGDMAEVVKNTGQLTDDDRAAIAAYLKIVPAIAAPAVPTE